MSFSYLSKSTHLFFGFFLILSLMIGSFSLFLIIAPVYLLLLVIFRKPPAGFRDTLIDGNDSSIFSPITGYVVSISQVDDHEFFGKSLTRIQLSQPFYKDSGIYLPLTCEVIDKRSKSGVKTLRNKKVEEKNFTTNFSKESGISLLLQTTKKSKIGLSVNQCKLGGFPDIAVFPGDRGLRQVNIGNIPFGGSIFLYFTTNYTSTLQVGDKVITGSSVIASYLGNDSQISTTKDNHA